MNIREKLERFALINILESDSIEAFEKMNAWIDGAMWMHEQTGGIKNDVSSTPKETHVCKCGKTYVKTYDHTNCCNSCLSEMFYNK